MLDARLVAPQLGGEDRFDRAGHLGGHRVAECRELIGEVAEDAGERVRERRRRRGQLGQLLGHRRHAPELLDGRAQAGGRLVEAGGRLVQVVDRGGEGGQ